MPDVVALVGSTGFIGGVVGEELDRRGVAVRPVAAPRLHWPPGLSYQVPELSPGVYQEIVDGLARKLDGARTVVNAAGLPDGTAPASLGLYGANALLPTLLARACGQVGVERYVHLSSAAVQGGAGQLDETPRTAPFSPYSHSKALGERLLLAEPPADRVLFRSTWVHDPDRPNTRALIRVARSPASCVAGDGSAPTPQVLARDIADSVAHLALRRAPVPPIVLQPHNGMTTGLLLWLLGNREPRHLPPRAAAALSRALAGYGRLGLRANAHARRVHLLLFGRQQVAGWLAEQGVVPGVRVEEWQRLASPRHAAEGV